MKVRSSSRIAALLLFLFTLPVYVSTLSAQRSGQGAAPAGVRFRFAFGSLVGSGQNAQLKSITQDTVLNTGDRIKLMVELQQAGFVYLIHRSPQGEVNLLFPSSLTQTPAVAQKHYIPGGSNWFKLDKVTGNELFYLLASPDRLSSLEGILTRHAAAPAAGKAPVAAEIVAEIRRLRSESVGRGTAERPVVIGGNVRSLDSTVGPPQPDVDSIAVPISSPGFYSRAFTIEHR